MKKKISSPAPVNAPASSSAHATHAAPPLPLITATIEPCFIIIEGIGQTASEVAGAFSIGKRLAMAYAELTKGNGAYSGISGNVHDAFEITAYSTDTQTVCAKLKPGIQTMEFPTADLAFIAAADEARKASGLRRVMSDEPSVFQRRDKDSDSRSRRWSWED